MKIDLNTINESMFNNREFVVAGELVHLVYPMKVGTEWTSENLHFRSSVWDDDGNLISAGFPKFFNWGEKPILSPVPSSLKDATVIEKMDGSLFIVSKFKGEYILRTRGTIDARVLDNGDEISVFEQNFLPYCDELNKSDTWDFSLLFEWVSSTNKIVITYDDCPDWILIGGVNHSDYSLFAQERLDIIAETFDWKRPVRYKFSTITELLESVDSFNDKEGVVVYTKNDQTIHKCKSAWYLKLHHLKSELSSLEKVMDVWFYQNKVDYVTFYNYIAMTFDYELAEYVKGNISKICDAYKQVTKIVDGMTKFVEIKVKPLKSRKEQAQLILSSYGDTNRAGYVFNILDGIELTNEHYKKLMFQVLK